jgi:hypothetical protein
VNTDAENIILRVANPDIKVEKATSDIGEEIKGTIIKSSTKFQRI